MDNFRMDVTCEGRRALVAVLTVAFAQHSPKGASHYALNDNVMVWFWTDPKESSWREKGAKTLVALPAPFNAVQAADFTLHWLENAANYGTEPDHDGGNSKGWRVWNEDWGHVMGSWAGILAVNPAWALHGK